MQKGRLRIVLAEHEKKKKLRKTEIRQKVGTKTICVSRNKESLQAKVEGAVHQRTALRGAKNKPKSAKGGTAQKATRKTSCVGGEKDTHSRNAQYMPEPRA